MAGVNQVFSLADDVARYLKACGKRSILETKPLQAKINPKELGYFFPDGSITFQTEKAAQIYARNICMKQGLLPASEQVEIAVLRQKNRILGVAEGSHQRVDCSSILKPHRGKNNLVIEHFHPDIWGKGKTYPLSVGADSYLLGSENLQAITAYNSLGQYSRVEKLPHFNRHLENDFQDLHRSVIQQLVASEDELIAKKLLQELPHTNFKIASKTRQKLTQLSKELSKKYYAYCKTEEYPQILNKIWLENSEKYGMKYSTNINF